MTNKEIQSVHSGIIRHLAGRRLKPALDTLYKLIISQGIRMYEDEWHRLNDTYHNMLKYTMEGVFDPERQGVYRKLITSVFELNDSIHGALRKKYSIIPDFEKKRISQVFAPGFLPDELREIKKEIEKSKHTGPLVSSHDIGSQGEEAEWPDKKVLLKSKELFYYIWLSNKLVPEDINSLNTYLQDPGVPAHYRSFLISALMLSQLRFFDPLKFRIIFDLCDSNEPEISQRALIALLLNIHKYDQRLDFYPEIIARLKIIFGNPVIRQNTETIIKQFIRSKGTEKLQERIREEFLPGIIKISTNLKDKIKLDSLMEEGMKEDGNPDWEKLLPDSPELINKMEEFSEMQMKGDDVMLGSFAMLKSFPFFEDAANWFIPFFPGNKDIEENIEHADTQIRQFVNAIEKAPLLCNSDKYSFCFSISKLPPENFRMLSQAISAEMDQLKEFARDEDLLNPQYKSEIISNQCIQDLYRFCKLYSGRGDFEDIFSWQLDFHHKNALSQLFNEDRRIIRNIAEYYLSREYFEEAAGIFNSLPEDEKSEEVYQKLGWCYQKTSDFASALDHYLKAELHGNSNIWTLKKIALCYRNLKRTDKALDYYREAEKSDPENLGIQLNIGHCLLELGRYEEALKCYFRVEYLSPGNKKVWRPIGWCSFITGNIKQAEKYFLKLMKEEPGRHDYISMGHVQWSLGQRKDALDYYLKSMSENGFTEDEFLAIFEEDLPHLINQGIDRDDIPIMLDQLRYSLGG